MSSSCLTPESKGAKEEGAPGRSLASRNSWPEPVTLLRGVAAAIAAKITRVRYRLSLSCRAWLCHISCSPTKPSSCLRWEENKWQKYKLD